MTEAQTIPAKYIFLDVVSFTHNRSVEAQTDIVHALNKIVAESIAEFEIDRESVIYLPTGDGICITLLNIVNPFDIHILIALSILKNLSEHNEKAEEDEQKFEVRIGINANDDNLVTDINGKQNIAGEGINMAARVMSKADGNHILVGELVYETLRSRKKYMKNFRGFSAEVKHGRQMKVYQYVAEGIGVNHSVPTAFQIAKKEVLKLSKLVAYYFAHAIQNEALSFENNSGGQDDYNLIVLFWFLAQDSIGSSNSSKLSPYSPSIYGKGTLNLKKVFEYYDSIDFSLVCEFAGFIAKELLFDHSQYFESDVFGIRKWNFINDNGKKKLKEEYPDIWKEFELDLII